jgi:hypothetical protein
VPVRPVSVGFACLLLRCVREPWFPGVSCARRVVCSGAVRAFLLRCLRRSFVRWCLLACASGVWRLWFCRAGCPPFGACPGVRRWASPVALLVRSCSALASSVWSLLPCVPCRLAFGLWWFACPGVVLLAGRLGSLRCVLAVACRCSCGRPERALVDAVCAGRSSIAVACVPLTGDRRWGSLGWTSTSAGFVSPALSICFADGSWPG